MKRAPDWFTPAMFVAAFVAWLYPAAGARGGMLHPEITVKAGVALVFVLLGLNLPPASLRRSALEWRLHATVQFMTFLVLPIFAAVSAWTLRGLVSHEARVGLIFLGALPSTVSSSIVLTGAAHGNVAAAAFNATLSNLLAIVLTPLLLGAHLAQTGQGDFVTPLVQGLVCWMLLPMAIGQVARAWLASHAERYRGPMRLVDRLVILLLIYTSLCDSFIAGLWTGRDWRWFLAMVAVPAVMLGFALGVLALATRTLRLSWPDRVAGIFCGSQKSLVSGAAIAHLAFPGAGELGVILAPVMVYHSMQLLVSGWLAGRWSLRAPA
jgi:solute carrier family 10 (sodium/bile acid cotransporter), member 7